MEFVTEPRGLSMILRSLGSSVSQVTYVTHPSSSKEPWFSEGFLNSRIRKPSETRAKIISHGKRNSLSL